MTRIVGLSPWSEGRLLVLRGGNMFDEQGQLMDEKIEARLVNFQSGFVEFTIG